MKVGMKAGRILRAATLALACALAAGIAAARELRAGPGTLAAALASASGGDEILLESGNYGDLTLTQDFSSEVTIRAIDQYGA
ncbi:hypothetical protein, partial [Halovulum marinum]|uniref:hypothetical protein n=1 Tax=Halovulum marinum TaxID=2662447 RepID=UPI0012B38944